LQKLIDELKQPKIEILKPGMHYVIYRADGVFAASTYTPTGNTVSESHIAYVECKEEEKAYYYAAVLNYLAHKVVTSGRSYARHQFARPLLAIYIAGLRWDYVDRETREKVVELSKDLHRKAQSLRLCKEIGTKTKALKEIEKIQEFKELVGLLDSRVRKERLEEALNLVSGTSED
jgi:hypothetical protein